MTPAAFDTVAAFDFDGTLTRGGSVLPFLARVRGPVPVALAVLRNLPAIARSAVLGGAAGDRVKESLFVRLLAGVPADDVRAAGVEFARRHLHRRLRVDTRARLEWHRAQGHAVVVVSASPECYVGPAAELLGADAALATRLAVSGDLLTGRYDGKNCRGGEKYIRVMGWLRARGGPDRPDLWAYGNSRGDLRLLAAADHAVDTGRLGPFGRLRRYPSLRTVVGRPAADRPTPDPA
ncbi:MAG: HAD-IB family hydrolase [Acidimicrobiales bacterium]